MATTRTRKSGTASSTRKAKTEKVDAYQLVTDKIVEALEHGVVPWHRPWSLSAGNGPRSLTTLKPYRGVNVFILGATSMVAGYTSPWWGTYKQISERGGQVRKGEKATPIVFWTFVGEKRDGAGKVIERGVPYLRRYMVFNAEQCDDLTVPATEEIPEVDPHEESERIVAGYVAADGPTLKHGSNDAYYSPTLDRVVMPVAGQFETVDHYYGALFHEMAHSTGVEKRLNRKDFSSGKFGDESYAKEELVAEMAAAFLCGEAGVDMHVEFRASYIASWLKALKNDNRLVVQAGGAAQKAADLILGRERASEATTAQEA